MFESDDFDQILTEFDIPKTLENNENLFKNPKNLKELNSYTKNCSILPTNMPKPDSVSSNLPGDENIESKDKEDFSDYERTHSVSKQNIINKLFDKANIRKFPGPAGILSNAEKKIDDSISHMELFSQDINVEDNKNNLFYSYLWKKLLNDVEEMNTGCFESINFVKEKTMSSSLCSQKAGLIAAFIEMIDRSAIDPLLVLKDNTGSIKCTLHRDAWSTFARYIVSDKCALILWKPTVLTTGITSKKHYLNITIDNIIALYCSNISNLDIENDKNLPNVYSRHDDDDLTIIKLTRSIDAGINVHKKEAPVEAMSFLKDLNFEEMFSDEELT